MTSSQIARFDSTLLSVIEQAKARGASFDDVQKYVVRLSLKSSRELVEALFEHANAEENLKVWAKAQKTMRVTSE